MDNADISPPTGTPAGDIRVDKPPPDRPVRNVWLAAALLAAIIGLVLFVVQMLLAIAVADMFPRSFFTSGIVMR